MIEEEIYPRDFYKVEKIINYKTKNNKRLYLIKWLNYPISDSTWEPKTHLINIDYMVKDFNKGYPRTIDREMYQEYLTFRNLKKLNKNKDLKEKILLNKKIKRENDEKSMIFDDSENYLDKLREHLYSTIYYGKKKNNFKEEEEEKTNNNENQSKKDIDNINNLNNASEETQLEDEKISINIKVNKLINPLIIHK